MSRYGEIRHYHIQPLVLKKNKTKNKHLMGSKILAIMMGKYITSHYEGRNNPIYYPNTARQYVVFKIQALCTVTLNVVHTVQ